MFYVALFRTHRRDPLSFVIDAITRGSYSHAAFYRSDTNEIIEAYWPRVRRRPLGVGELDDIDLFVLPFTQEQWAGVESYCNAAIAAHEPYSIAGLFRFLSLPRMFLGNGVEGNGKFATFCSQFVFEACEHGADHRLLNANSFEVDPVHLAWSNDLVKIASSTSAEK